MGRRESVRFRGTEGSGVAWSAANAFDGAELPFGLAGGVAFVVLGGAAEVVGGLRLVGGGHGGSLLVDGRLGEVGYWK